MSEKTSYSIIIEKRSVAVCVWLNDKENTSSALDNFEGDMQLLAFIQLSMLFLQKTGDSSVHQTGAAVTMDITDQPRNRPR